MEDYIKVRKCEWCEECVDDYYEKECVEGESKETLYSTDVFCNKGCYEEYKEQK